MATDNDIADRHSDRATVTTAPPPPTSLADDQRLRQLIELFPRARPEYLADVFRGFQAHGEDAVAMAVQHLVEVKGGAGEELVGGSTSTSATRSAASAPLDINTLINPLNVHRITDERVRLTLGNSNYYACALEALLARFPTVPKAHVRVALNMHRNQFAPTFLHFCETIGRTWEKKDPHPEENGDGSDESTSAIPQQKALPFKPLQNPRRPLPDDDKFGVRQLRARWSSDVSLDAIFLLEVDCLEERERVVAEEFDQKLAAKVNADEYEACGDLIECGCCYGDFAFELMVQCEEGHLFCRECARRAAEEQLGLRKCTLLCLSGDGCDASFPPTVIEQFLPEKTLELYHTIKQELDISSAIEDDSSYETCPFCPYGVFMESSPEENKVFECHGCGTDSCRLCHKKSHLPLSCAEFATDAVLDVRHRIEESMTEALIRECPKCKRKFVKEDGCNKMTCPTCKTLSCYICRVIIKGYEHFQKAGSTCPLFDDTARRNAQEVLDAANKAASSIETTVDGIDIQQQLEAERAKLNADLERQLAQPSKFKAPAGFERYNQAPEDLRAGVGGAGPGPAPRADIQPPVRPPYVPHAPAFAPVPHAPAVAPAPHALARPLTPKRKKPLGPRQPPQRHQVVPPPAPPKNPVLPKRKPPPMPPPLPVSKGKGKGKGKRPADVHIVIDIADDDNIIDIDDSPEPPTKRVTRGQSSSSSSSRR